MPLKLGSYQRWCFVVLISLIVVPESEEADGLMRLCGEKLVKTVIKLCKGCVHSSTNKRHDSINKKLTMPTLTSPRPFAISQPILANLLKSPAGDHADDDNLSSLKKLAEDKSLAENNLHNLVLSKPLDFYTTLHGIRTKRQIAQECCIEQCSYERLKEYCSDSCFPPEE